MQPQLEHDASPTPARRGGAPATGLPPDLTAYVLSPKDVVAARSRDWDDRVSWLLQRRRYQDALQLARRQQAHLVRHKVLDVAELLLGHLLHDERRAAAAAELCPELLGDAVRGAPRPSSPRLFSPRPSSPRPSSPRLSSPRLFSPRLADVAAAGPRQPRPQTRALTRAVPPCT